jgi:cytochrome c2
MRRGSGQSGRSGAGGIVGRKAGTAPGCRYSSAMKNSGIAWDDKLLNAFLESPKKAVSGHRIPYPGLKDATDRADSIGYIENSGTLVTNFHVPHLHRDPILRTRA